MPAMNRDNFAQNSSVNLLVELNHLKKGLRSTQATNSNRNELRNPNQNSGRGYQIRQTAPPIVNSPRALGGQAMPNNPRSKVDQSFTRQLPGFSKNVDVSRMSYDQFGQGNSLNFNSRNQDPSGLHRGAIEAQNQGIQNNGGGMNTGDGNIKNSFSPHDRNSFGNPNPHMDRNFGMGNPPSTRSPPQNRGDSLLKYISILKYIIQYFSLYIINIFLFKEFI